ncbi:putative tRNA(Ile)-lysidine synthase [Talaromyces islandicus]|uniref:tRNA(Ile)-lysidine synthetase n=1 Tax=Talaromyces islandicus TaxID=28573 RepID=A0A0U1LLT8_TALIS|nr:putative tRNA(Ile)-lysidine synthase [Talaromyces islandicus]
MASLLKPKPSQSITVQQFYQSLDAAWRGKVRYPRPRVPLRIGIAVSGGADSMALAVLCRHLQLAKPELELDFKAFIVDHKARKESSEEAVKVSGWLKRFGMESEILPLVWSSGKDATEVTAFETSARQKRYLALGQACNRDIRSVLLTGHHLDDNVETAILRLCQRSGRQGLTGISPMSPIPECQHVWGVSGSGYYEPIRGQQTIQNKVTGQVSKNDVSFNMAAGGTFLCRPLLPYSKSSILETCKNLRIPYVNDPTNLDTRLTARNTIRSLLSANKLPRALNLPSIETFISRNRDSLHNMMKQTDSLLRECKILEFFAESSTMKIQFPELDQSHPLMSPEMDSRLLPASLRRITELISPLDYKSLPLQKYAPFARAIFAGQQSHDFSVGAAHFRSLSVRDKGTKNVWHVSRTPFKAYSAPELAVSLHEPLSSTPVLWDSRYWLRFEPILCNMEKKHNPPPTVTIRSLTKEDIKPISYALERQRQSKEIFGVAPYKSRFTLPVVTVNGTTLGGCMEEKYLSLPTLGIDLSSHKDFRIQSSWAYMKVDVEALQLLGWLRP